MVYMVEKLIIPLFVSFIISAGITSIFLLTIGCLYLIASKYPEHLVVLIPLGFFWYAIFNFIKK